MNNKKYSIFVIFCTVFTIGLLMGYNDGMNDIYRRGYIEENTESMNSDIKNSDQVDEDDENKNHKLTQNNSEKQISLQEKEKNLIDHPYESDRDVKEFSSSYYNKNSQNINDNTKVFKVTADEIISDLKPLEKAKILWVCTKLTREEYADIEEYLSYNNEKLGVIKVYEILEKKLDEDSMEEVKIIFSKYMDMEKVKEIFY